MKMIIKKISAFQEARLKYTAIMLLCIVTMVFFAAVGCEKQNSSFLEDEFCSCFHNFEDINKTIPVVNDFLANMPNEMKDNGGWTYKEQIFQDLVAWFKSLRCVIDANILWSVAAIYPPEMGGVSISVKDNNIVKELYLDFAIVEGYIAYTHILGYHYAIQDAIHVKTKFTKIIQVFDFISTLDFKVKEIQYGMYVSNMPSNADNLQTIINGLKAKPYTSDDGAGVAGNMQGFNNQIIIYIRLFDMENEDYQADWLNTMNYYELVEYDFEEDDENIYGPGHVILFQIPEGTGKQWEAKFIEYDFVRWAGMSYSARYIR